MTPFHVVLLAGGTGSRLGKEIPKQYLKVKHKTLARYSFDVFAAMSEVDQLIVVCHPSYQDVFANDSRVCFAKPGARRQDSVFNGLEAIEREGLVCIHDVARPFVTEALIRKVVREASVSQAAVLGVPVKGTIKVCDQQHYVQETPNRSALWEMQTPQVIHSDLLYRGFEVAHRSQLTVTDDVSLVELIGIKVKVVESCYTNFKVTTPEDLIFMNYLLDQHVRL